MALGAGWKMKSEFPCVRVRTEDFLPVLGSNKTIQRSLRTGKKSFSLDWVTIKKDRTGTFTGRPLR
jgi:hypothetical protein